MKAVIIGASGHFDYALKSSNGASIMAYAPGSADEDFSRLESFANLKKYGNYVQMINEIKPDLAIINPQFYLNNKILIDCLAHDIHCFVEKPIALNTQELEKLKATLKLTKAKFGTMMIHRYEPWFAKAFALFKGGSIGEAISIQAQKSYKMGEKALWAQEKSKFGGIVPWVGSHAIDWLLALDIGRPKVVFAQQNTTGNKGNGQVESNASLGLRLGDTMATVSLDYLRPECAPTHGDDRIRIVGTKGIIEVANSSISLVSNQGHKVIMNDEAPNIFDDFVNSIIGRSDYRISQSEALVLAETCIKAEEMANTLV